MRYKVIAYTVVLVFWLSFDTHVLYRYHSIHMFSFAPIWGRNNIFPFIAQLACNEGFLEAAGKALSETRSSRVGEIEASLEEAKAFPHPSSWPLSQLPLLGLISCCSKNHYFLRRQRTLQKARFSFPELLTVTLHMLTVRPCCWQHSAWG